VVSTITVRLAALSLLVLSISSAAQSAPKLKVYISVDMEGVAGVVTSDQLASGGFEYQRFREFMTREVLAAVSAAKEGGATEILISDSHGNGESLLVEMFPSDIRLVRSEPRPLGMMEGIDATFDCVIFIGYHASTNNMQGVRAHTFSSASLTRVALNGVNVTEGAFNAALAGHFGVPVIMMSGDDAAIAELRALVGDIETAETKKALGFHSANTITPEASYELIGRTVRAALGRRHEFKPYRVSSPVTLDVTFKNYLPSELLSYLAIVQRTDSHSVRFRGRDMVEVYHFMEFITRYNIALQP
jgi:D-amino peptidase